MVDDNGGARLKRRIGPRPIVIVFMVLFVGVALAFATSEVISHDVASALLCVGMACFGIGIFAIGRSWARNEQKFLIDFLRDTIDARKV